MFLAIEALSVAFDGFGLACDAELAVLWLPAGIPVMGLFTESVFVVERDDLHYCFPP